MVINTASSGKSFLLLLLTLLSASTCIRALDPDACPYDFTVLQRLGATDYTDLPLRILRQSGNTVEFTVGNTWTTASGDSVDQIFTSYAGDATGNKACDLRENVPAMQSIDSKLTAYCTPTGISIVRLYVRDASFDAAKDTATIPECCVDPNGNSASPPALEYMAILNCNPTCASGTQQVEVRIGNEINDAFELVYLTDFPTQSPSESPTQIPSSSPTTAPSSIPSVAPTGTPSASPSGALSSQPTSYLKVSCPPAGGDPMLLDVSMGTVLDIDHWSGTDSVCALVEMAVSNSNEPSDGLVPVGRSYGGQQWEPSAGPFSAFDWNCGGSSCTIRLPDPEFGRSFVLITYTHTHAYTQYDEIARFLEKTTFGPTRDEIFDGSFPGKDAWMTQQFALPASSHRQYYRERVTDWHGATGEQGLLKNSPCDVGARFRKYVFLKNDRDRYVTFQDSPYDSTKVVMYINTVLVSVINLPVEWASNRNGPTDPIDLSGRYQVCANPLEGIGGRVLFYVDGVCRHIYFNGTYGNPEMSFDDDHLSYVETDVVSLDSGSYAEILTAFSFQGTNEVLQLTSTLGETSCNMSDDTVLGYPERLIVGRTTDVNGTEQYWAHTTLFETHTNDLNTPLLDGGKKAVELTKDAPNEEKRYRAFCSSAPRSFLNEDSCILSDDACYANEGSDKDIDLTLANLEKIHSATGGVGGLETKYVYVITGLPNDAGTGMGEPMTPYPCTPGARSRWAKRVLGVNETCTRTERMEGTFRPEGNEWEDDTKQIFENLLKQSDDPNPYITDVFFPAAGTTCNPLDADQYDFIIEIDGTCYENTHPDNYQVRDMTYWTTSAHKGNKPGSNKIKNFAEAEGTWILSFPGNHELARWDANNFQFPIVGRYGDTTTIKSLPSTLLREDIAQAFGSAKAALVNDRVVVCGSPYEVANVVSEDYGPIRRGGFDMRTQYNNTSSGSWLTEQKVSVWLARALWAPDQLRQRMAFALSQILVVSPDTASTDFSESYISYYDIFVRHAFGNYLDILREVTHHPLMSYMLTYIDGLSTAYSKVRLGLVQQADENYAREVMQLFTIGLYKLNIDGTTQLDDDGNEIRTYTNFDISEYAKVYTGFQRQSDRGNIDGHYNLVDPLKTRADYKDHLPKMGLDSQYIGDGYPLCSDLPDQHFLKKGATYLLLGSDPNPTLLKDPSTWWQAAAKRLSLDFDGALAQHLCNDGGDTQCDPQAKVTLTQDIACTGIECDLDTPRTFEVADGLWFEYMRPPCVHTAFYDNAQTIRRPWSDGFEYYMCGNPIVADAGTTCCNVDESWDSPWRKENFGGERVTLAEATQRCDAANNERLCVDPWADQNDCKDVTQGGCDVYQFYWSSQACTMQAKINKEGNIAIVHKHHVPGKPKSEENKPHVWNTYRQVDEKTIMNFRVDWKSDIDNFLDDYDGNCAASNCWTNEYDGLCQCNVTVSESPAFKDTSELESADNVLSTATFGVFDMVSSQMSFVSSGVDNVEIDSASATTFTIDTVFKVVDSNGIVRYRKNLGSTAQLGDAGPLLRTPVSFWSLAEYTKRDARYEVDAALEQYFYHQNTAPFLALRFAQRFGISNPSPRHIKEIATAFRTGSYNGFGSNKYGCLKATVAAVILDREAQDSSLDLDPTHGQLKEPFLKLIQLMRSLEYTPDADNPIPRFQTNLQERLGQEAYGMPSVFSFFTPQFSPTGPVQSAGLVSPESQVLNGPLVINLLNLFRSYVKYGMTRCYDGFGTGKLRYDYGQYDTCEIGDETTSHGNSRYAVSSGLNASLAHDVVEELATILTAGRLSPDNRAIVKTAFDFTLENGQGEYEAMINAQQIIATSPEFHTTGLTRKVPTPRTFEGSGNATGIPYKSVIFFMLPGGLDSWHVLAPESCTGVNSKNQTVLDQYMDQRGVMAFDRDAGEFDLKIDPNHPQPCESFAIHKSLPYVHKLYNDNDLLFISNVGVINQQDMDVKNWNSKTRTRLFDHGGMQEETKKVDPYDIMTGTGVLGRAKDMLTKNGHNVNSLGINQASVTLNGVPGASKPITTVSQNGVKQYGNRPNSESYFDISEYTAMVNSATTPFTNVFAETYSNTVLSGFGESADLSDFLASTELSDAYDGKNSGLNRKMSMLNKLMQTREDRKSDRDLYYVDHGGWDHHSAMKYNMEWRLQEVNDNLELLIEQIKADGLWDSTTIVVASEFARTITPNNNDGSDHAWGGNYFMMGGQVKGGRVVGEFPDDFTAESPLNGSGNTRVRFIPTTSWDSIWHSVIQWLGIEDADDIDYCLPNKDNTAPNPVVDRGDFPLFEKFDLFKDPNTDAPSGAPTFSPMPSPAPSTSSAPSVNETDSGCEGEACST